VSDLNSLMIFAKVVEANSFSKAARRLKMPTSTVSRRIADLEDQLGVRLLERSTRSLRLTDGHLCYEKIEKPSVPAEGLWMCGVLMPTLGPEHVLCQIN
jgi:DNA-binding transcriptional LysR family regulator